MWSLPPQACRGSGAFNSPEMTESSRQLLLSGLSGLCHVLRHLAFSVPVRALTSGGQVHSRCSIDPLVVTCVLPVPQNAVCIGGGRVQGLA